MNDPVAALIARLLAERWLPREDELARQALTDAERESFGKLNAAYVERFGFPFIIAVRGRSSHEILAAFEERLGNDGAAEFDTACKEVERIALLRLRDILPS